jgi:hypothetical protein
MAEREAAEPQRRIRSKVAPVPSKATPQHRALLMSAFDPLRTLATTLSASPRVRNAFDWNWSESGRGGADKSPGQGLHPYAAGAFDLGAAEGVIIGAETLCEPLSGVVGRLRTSRWYFCQRVAASTLIHIICATPLTANAKGAAPKLDSVPALKRASARSQDILSFYRERTNCCV